MTTLIATADTQYLKIACMSLDLKQDKAMLQIFYTTTNCMVLDIIAWMWKSGGAWRFGWSVKKLGNVTLTIQSEEKIKAEVQKILLPMFSGAHL